MKRNTYFAFDYLPSRRRTSLTAWAISPWKYSQDAGISAGGAGGAPGHRRSTRDARIARIITAWCGSETQEVWLAIGTLLMHFDKMASDWRAFAPICPAARGWKPRQFWSNAIVC